jgi:diguanylate cyclase (GGDEF)-like protein
MVGIREEQSFSGEGKRQVYLSWVFAAALFFSVLLLFLFSAYTSYRAVNESARQNLRFISSIAAGQTEKTLMSIGEVLNGLISVAALLEDTHNGHAAHDDQFSALLRQYRHANEYLMDLVVADPDGNILHWSGDGVPPYVGDRDYIMVHRMDHDDLYVGRPLLSRVHEGNWFFGVSKAVRGDDGTIDAIFVAIVNVDALHDMYSGLEYPKGATLLVTTDEGNIITRIPGHAALVGKHYDLLQEIYETSHSSGSFKIRSPFDGQLRIVGYSKLQTLPLMVFSSFPEQEVIASWKRDTMFLGLAALVMLGVVGVLSVLHIRGQAKLHRLGRQLEVMASTDPLTGLLNRRVFMAEVSKEFERVKRYGGALAFVMLDIDHFKQVNDRYGHEVGDRTLVSIAELLEALLRRPDIACRFGGEEFALLLPGTGQAGAMNVAEKLRDAIERLRLKNGEGGVRVTASFGVSCAGEADLTADEMISRADDSLYEAKRAGRNRVCCVETVKIP